MAESPLTNGHDKESEATLAEACDIAGGTMATGVVILQEQLAAVQINAARQAERATIEALIQDAQARCVKAREANNYTTEAEAVREIIRLQLCLCRRGFE